MGGKDHALTSAKFPSGFSKERMNLFRRDLKLKEPLCLILLFDLSVKRWSADVIKKLAVEERPETIAVFDKVDIASAEPCEATSGARQRIKRFGVCGDHRAFGLSLDLVHFPSVPTAAVVTKRTEHLNQD